MLFTLFQEGLLILSYYRPPSSFQSHDMKVRLIINYDQLLALANAAAFADARRKKVIGKYPMSDSEPLTAAYENAINTLISLEESERNKRGESSNAV